MTQPLQGFAARDPHWHSARGKERTQLQIETGQRCVCVRKIGRGDRNGGTEGNRRNFGPKTLMAWGFNPLGTISRGLGLSWVWYRKLFFRFVYLGLGGKDWAYAVYFREAKACFSLE